MANPEHVAVVKQGAAAIAAWNKTSAVSLDLQGASLRGIDLRFSNLQNCSLTGADLREADLSGAQLTRANLQGTDLTGARLSFANLLWSCLAGAKLPGAEMSYSKMDYTDWADADLAQATLRGATLLQAKLKGARLEKAQLGLANLMNADLSGANLAGADLTAATLCMANLSGADLSGCTLDLARLDGAVLTNADLSDASLSFALIAFAGSHGLSNANFAGARFQGTLIAACDLRACSGLANAVHVGPIFVDISTIAQSSTAPDGQVTADVKTFLLNAGVDLKVVEAVPRIATEAEYWSCFICYGDPDLDFAQRLARDLRAKHAPCWLYSMDSTPGQVTWQEVGLRRRQAGKMIVLCSAQSLIRDGVLKEIEEQIDEEPDKMVPVSLDTTWTQPGFRVVRGQRDLKPSILQRNYADFSDNSKYPKSLGKLLKALKRDVK